MICQTYYFYLLIYFVSVMKHDDDEVGLLIFVSLSFFLNIIFQ